MHDLVEHFWLKYMRHSIKRCLYGTLCHLKSVYIYFSADASFPDVQAAFSIGNKVPPCHQRCWLFNWALTTSQMVQFLLSPEDVASMLSKNNSILRFVWQNSFYCILNELWSRDDSSVSGLCSSMTSSQHDKALTCTCGWHNTLCS